MHKVRKAIIPAGGFGTRTLPATKVVPKELLPVVDKPLIQFIIEEIVESGIEEGILSPGREKGSIEDHFDSFTELELFLGEKEKARSPRYDKKAVKHGPHCGSEAVVPDGPRPRRPLCAKPHQ